MDEDTAFEWQNAGDTEYPIYYRPIDFSACDLVKRCRWEADAIEAHLAANANRPRAGQRKTARLLRRLADHLEKKP